MDSRAKKTMVVVAGAVVLFMSSIFIPGVLRGIISAVSPTMTVGRAASNLNDEFNQRVRTTPFQAFGMLFNSLEYGTTNVDFVYREEWSGWGGANAFEAGGSFSLFSNSEENDVAILGDLNIDGVGFDVSVFLNLARLAFGSSIIDRNYYGIYFDTFRDDLRPFGRELGLTRSEMDSIADFVEEFAEMIRNGNTWDTWEDSEYMDAFTNFLRGAEMETGNAEINVNGSAVNVRRIEYAVTHEDISVLLRNWLDIFENDTAMTDLFNNDSMFGAPVDIWQEMINELTELMDEFDHDFRGNFSVAFYVGGRDRLYRINMALDGYIMSLGSNESFAVELTFDFGASAMDTWRLDMVISADGEYINAGIIWDADITGGIYNHSMKFLTFDANGAEDSFTFFVDWNPTSGTFTLSGEENHPRWGVSYSELLSGIFVTDSENFRLRFEHENYWGWGDRETFWIEISTQAGTNIPEVDFINIRDWGMEFIYRLEEAFWELGF